MTSSAKRTIGIVSWDFLYAKGGMGRSMEWIASALSTDYAVVVGTPEVSDQRHEIRDQVFEITPLLSFTRKYGGHLLLSFCLPFVLERWINAHHIDVLLTPGGPGGVFLWRKPSVPYICSVYHVYEQQARLVPGQWWKKVFIPVERRTYRRAVGILSFNTDTQVVLENAYKIPADRFHPLSHAIDPSWARAAVSKIPGLCVCVARLEARKGVVVLIDAWKSVRAAIPTARLIIIGQGIQAETIDAAIAKLSGVVRIPSVLFQDLQHIVRQADVAVCPAYLEGFGLAAAEAMMAGTAVVAADSEGLHCLIDDQRTGFLFASGNADQLAQTLILSLQNDHLRQTVSVAAQGEAEKRFDSVMTSKVLVSAFRGILDRDECTSNT
jgi:glycosyltransferase involved in cell wall biosynthesis